MDFQICGQLVSFSQNQIDAHTVKSTFGQRAQLAASAFRNKYNNYQNWRQFVEVGPSDGYKILQEEVEFAAQFLVQRGNYGMSGNVLLNQYGEAIMEPWTTFIEELAELLESIHDMQEQAEYARELRKASRGRVVGGGFGVSGALKGMAFAGAANLASGSMHSVANAFGNARTRNEIAKQEAALFKNEDFKKAVCARIYESAKNIIVAILVELGIGSEDLQPQNSEVADNFMHNYPLVPQEDRLNVLINALNCDVYNQQVYEHLLGEFEGAEDAAKIGRLFGLEMDGICAAALGKMVPSSYELQKLSLEDKELLLVKYRQKKEKLGISKTLMSENSLGIAIIESFVPENWRMTDPENIPALLDHIREKKRSLHIESNTYIEEILSKNYADAYMVNGVKFDSIQQAKIARSEREQILKLCENLKGKRYEELLAIKEQIYQESTVEPKLCCKSEIDSLERRIREEDEVRRTFRCKIYKTVEDAKQAAEIYREARDLLERCDFTNKEEVSKTRSKLLLLGKKITPCCIDDCLSAINIYFNEFCTFQGIQLSSIEEKEKVEQDFSQLQSDYMASPETLSEEEINRILAMVTQSANIHTSAKELFANQCKQLIENIHTAEQKKKLAEHAEEVSRTRSELSKHYAFIDLDSRTHGNHGKLVAVAKELETYDPEYTEHLLPQVNKAISECQALYKQEDHLRNNITQLEDASNPITPFIRIIASLFLYIIIELLIFRFLSGWLMWLFALGGIYAFFSRAGEHIHEHKSNCQQLKDCRNQLKEIQGKINPKVESVKDSSAKSN